MGPATIRFDVEQAGCASCADRIKAALASAATVEQITIDEELDTATVFITARQPIDENAVNAVLALASAGAGHEYRIRPGSWQGLQP